MTGIESLLSLLGMAGGAAGAGAGAAGAAAPALAAGALPAAAGLASAVPGAGLLAGAGGPVAGMSAAVPATSAVPSMFPSLAASAPGAGGMGLGMGSGAEAIQSGGLLGTGANAGFGAVKPPALGFWADLKDTLKDPGVWALAQGVANANRVTPGSVPLSPPALGGRPGSAPFTFGSRATGGLPAPRALSLGASPGGMDSASLIRMLAARRR